MSITKTLAAAFAMAVPMAASGQTLLDIDFEAPATSGAVFAFADGTTGVELSNSSTAPGATGLGGQIAITGLGAAQPAFVGGGFDENEFGSGINPFNFSTLLGVAPGAFTEADFADLVLSYEVSTSLGAGVDSVRLEAIGTGNFGNALFLGDPTSTEGSFQLITGDFASSANLGVFVAALNSNASGAAGFRFSISPTDDGFSVGDTVTFDNITVTRVPEPGSLALLGLGATALLARRRKA